MRAKNAYGGGRKEGKAKPGEGRPEEKEPAMTARPKEAGASTGPPGRPTARQPTTRSKGPQGGRGEGGEPAEASGKGGGKGTEGSQEGRQPRDTRSVLGEESTEKSGRSSSPHHKSDGHLEAEAATVKNTPEDNPQ